VFPVELPALMQVYSDTHLSCAADTFFRHCKFIVLQHIQLVPGPACWSRTHMLMRSNPIRVKMLFLAIANRPVLQIVSLLSL
jgi:hypothetical protein